LPRLLSVNVGLPRDIAWRGKTVRTAIWKTPVQGGRMVRRLNIDGDGQGDLAGHGGEHRAVFVYQIDSYHYWQSQLGRNDFTYGQFGENFTIDGLSDQEVCIGDRYRAGGALFEVRLQGGVNPVEHRLVFQTRDPAMVRCPRRPKRTGRACRRIVVIDLLQIPRLAFMVRRSRTPQEVTIQRGQGVRGQREISLKVSKPRFRDRT
jgi:MOSC domain-containing protein YiiM